MKIIARSKEGNQIFASSRVRDVAIHLWGKDLNNWSISVEFPFYDLPPKYSVDSVQHWIQQKINRLGLLTGPVEPAKPPLGLRPRGIAKQQREQEILEAIRRYADAKLPIPIEWLDELEALQ